MRVILLRKPNSRKLEALCLGRHMPFQAAGVNRTENLGIQNKDEGLSASFSHYAEQNLKLPSARFALAKIKFLQTQPGLGVRRI
jgi:hypothetical protein